LSARLGDHGLGAPVSSISSSGTGEARRKERTEMRIKRMEE